MNIQDVPTNLVGHVPQKHSKLIISPCGKKKAGNQKALGWSRGAETVIDDWLLVGVDAGPDSRDIRDFDVFSAVTKSNHALKKSTRLARLSTQAPSGLQDSYATCCSNNKKELLSKLPKGPRKLSALTGCL